MPLLPSNNVAMPGNPQDPHQKPGVVVRGRKTPKSVATPSSPQTPHATPAHVSPRIATPRATHVRTPTLTPPEDPARIAARRAQRLVAIQTTLNELMTRWPHTFSAYPEPVRPLTTGIGIGVATQLPHVSKTIVRHAIAMWQRQRKTTYLQALIAGGSRYDLEGNPRGEVTPEHQQRAREELATWRARRQKKPRTASPSDDPPPAPDGSTNNDSHAPPTAREL